MECETELQREWYLKWLFHIERDPFIYLFIFCYPFLRASLLKLFVYSLKAENSWVAKQLKELEELKEWFAATYREIWNIKQSDRLEKCDKIHHINFLVPYFPLHTKDIIPRPLAAT